MYRRGKKKKEEKYQHIENQQGNFRVMKDPLNHKRTFDVGAEEVERVLDVRDAVCGHVVLAGQCVHLPVTCLGRLGERVQHNHLLLEKRVVLRLVLLAEEFVLRIFRFAPPLEFLRFR